jgi:hypothetical protein
VDKKSCLVFTLLIFLASKSVSASTRGEVIAATLDQLDAVFAKGASYPTDEIYLDETKPSEYISENQGSLRTYTYDGEPSRNSNNNLLDGTLWFSAGYDGNHIRYKELDGNNILDEDYGIHKGYFLNLGFKSSQYIKEIMARPYLEAYYHWCQNRIKYKGRASNGITTRDFDFKQRSVIEKYGLKFGGYADFTEKGEISGYLDVGKRSWYRGKNGIVNNVLTYAEKYYWVYLGVGAGLNFSLFPRFHAGLDAEWLFTPGTAKMRANLYEGGTFNLKNVNGVELKLPLKYNLIKNLSFDLTPYFTYWHIGKSDYVLIKNSYYYEPDSNTHILGALAGFTYTL